MSTLNETLTTIAAVVSRTPPPTSAGGVVDGVVAADGSIYNDKATDAALCGDGLRFCADFFNVQNTIYIFYIFLRLMFFAFILFLSSRIPKDFLKRFTLYLTIPLFLSEFARMATYIMFYVKHFHIEESTAMRLITAESIFDLIYNILSTFVYYAFMAKSIVVYQGLFLAFLNPEKYEQWKSGFWFHTASIVPFVILIAMNVPWGQIKDIEVYIKYSCRIILGLGMVPLYLRTLLFLSWKKQQRETVIDDRAIIRKAKSRLIWFTVYMTVMNFVNLFNFLESFFFIIFYINPKAVDQAEGFMGAFDTCMYYASIGDEIRPIAIFICTLLFIPVYRDAIFFCRKASTVFKSAVLDLNEPA